MSEYYLKRVKCTRCGKNMKYNVCGDFWYCPTCDFDRGGCDERLPAPEEGELLRVEVDVPRPSPPAQGVNNLHVPRRTRGMRRLQEG